MKQSARVLCLVKGARLQHQLFLSRLPSARRELLSHEISTESIYSASNVSKMSYATSSGLGKPGKLAKRKPKRFAPLDPAVDAGHELPKLKGIIFDMDGTLW